MASPPELVDDAVAEILLRLPPADRASLVRASLVCKPWRRVLSDPAFPCRYRAFHRTPPLLVFYIMPDFPHPGADGRRTRPLDCRHGRVLIHMLQDESEDYLVWDPVTGDRRAVPEPDIDWMAYTAAVDATWDLVWASVYSSETGAWSTPVSLDNGRDFYVRPRRGTLVGDDEHWPDMYFTMTRDTVIGKYDWGKNCLSVVKPPPLATYGCRVTSEGAAEWVIGRVIELETIIPLANPSDEVSVVGSAEGVDIIFISTSVGLFMIELKSGRVRKVDEPGVYFSVLPYMNFYTPDCGSLLSLARTL
uniref:F-box domain-containing protein n=1 Tax=Setaria viridis TaxID=4556 RepID=A0A4V6DAK3_SETVI|nr:hypothetical protein SEVIR_2G028700v2 [Setaria viridis]